ncbi:DUF3139 domain-containing protein [Virgibacillus sp. MSP4-1]|uniref:DUF3139 domain-containing protein n=1 Tax=Virgibacillus sp. MSP4-1 TaxID=2700081 RepID=UPI0003A48897|nr:DUF3139 domain-containing protein [Virgibacillus sp. MSP4-1]QHS21484.1 DUF3139 domain-containing protein [Virgibacillus sp. MSP4-1]
MTRLHKIVLIVSTLLILILISPLIYVEVNKKIYENRVTDYLVEEQGYEKEDIASVKGVWGVKMPNFYTTVIFENEPYVEYTYFAHNGVGQFDYEVIDGEHKEINVEDLKNYE